MPVDLDYFNHPKTVKLRKILDCPEADIYPIRLWAWAAKYARRGHFACMTDIELACGWTGTSEVCAKALLTCEFVDPVKDDYAIHDWMQHAGKFFASYEKKKKRMRETFRKSAGSLPEVCRIEESRVEEIRGEETNSLPSRATEIVTCPPCLVPASPPKKTRRAVGYSADFEAFWAAYPRRVGKGAALKAWMNIAQPSPSPAVMTVAASAYAEKCCREKTEEKYIAHPSTWINARRWEDEAAWVKPTLEQAMIQAGVDMDSEGPMTPEEDARVAAILAGKKP